MKLFLNKIKLTLQKRTKINQNKKSYEVWAAKGYNDEPQVSIIIQSHNKSLQIKHIIPKLRNYPSIEIIVIDDGSELSHTKELTRYLKGSNEFLIRSNDLYENIMYDKVIRFANGKYIALLQDDDDFADLSWITEAIKYFEKYPRLAILGGKDGLDIVFEEDTQIGHGGKYEHEDKFSFVPAVNRAPMWLNKQLFTEYLHHIDFQFAPFQFDDYELCARAWLTDLQVGWYNANFKSLSVGGMRLWNNKFTEQQSLRNGKRLYQLYKDKKNKIYRKIEEAKL
ncbi:glycosyltransferase [Bacteroides faecium]|uniref:Glycosyltransferase family 2 protein n=1 Tax=Bacteroides faecium TaxID=2715212 RepID=A0A6H0KIN8_9BACE|nr:glycosyltransferase [Bacteroides faecium]QIU93272.1 glycosyltransferase family 2 protein [Bacteroides faecium]